MNDDSPDEASAQKMRMMQRIRDKSFVTQNKKRFFGKDEGMSRWVGTSINFEAPFTDKVGVKLSKKLKR